MGFSGSTGSLFRLVRNARTNRSNDISQFLKTKRLGRIKLNVVVSIVVVVGSRQGKERASESQTKEEEVQDRHVER